MNCFRTYARRVSANNSRTCWVLKCDIRKFFASIDHSVLFEILKKRIKDERTIELLVLVVGSFDSGVARVGLPLGNLTSQLLVNIYMNEFYQFAKHELKTKYYIRYADDFVFLSESKVWLEGHLKRAAIFLQEKLRLELHPDKVSISTSASGVDFLGWVHFPDHRVIRTITKRRAFRRVRMAAGRKEELQSYLGQFSHGMLTQ